MKVDLSGRRFGRWSVLVPTDERGADESIKWLCVCDCGNTGKISSNSLLQNGSNSCGCLRKEIHSTHGMSKTRQYRCYMSMMKRCFDTKNERYKDYGGRGVTVCDKWNRGFEFFWEDMRKSYNNNLTLDRINVNGNYSKENCRWSTPKQQSNNTRNNIKITYNGETKTISEWAEILNIKTNTLRCRYKRGWNIERLMEQPIQKHKILARNFSYASKMSKA